MHAYIHLDTETTTLDATTGHIRSIGWVVTDGHLVDLPAFPPYEITEAIHPTLWHPETLAFAASTYGPEFYTLQRMQGVSNWTTALIPLVAAFQELVDTLKAHGFEPWLVVNHPEFDVAMLRSAYKLVGMNYPIKYNHHLDWQSLYLGFMAGCISTQCKVSGVPAKMPSSREVLRDYDPAKGKANVAHTALADARRQLGLLRNLGLRLPK